MTTTQPNETDRIREIFEDLAPRYDRVMDWVDPLLFRRGREWLARQASGKLLEVGVGTGRSFESLGRDVAVTAIDVSPRMLARASERSVRLGLSANLRVADAQALPFSDGSFDTVMFSLALCSIPDDRRAIAEAVRVLRPGGRIAMLEHVRSSNPLIEAVQRLLDPLAVRLQGDHLLREPAELLRAEGLVVEHIRRSRLGIVEGVVARKSGS
jgi:ubiquinone/menaquinone biosynthesis C-methylase UbiE